MNKYAASTNSFYPSSLLGRYSSIPDDAVDVDDAVMATFQASPPAGKARGSANGYPAWVDQPEPSLSERISRAERSIDEAAGRARARYVADGAFIDQEYALVAADVKSWRDAGSPADAVPQTISAWADATGMTDEAAAANIEVTSAQFNQLLAAIRTIRLTAKAMINEDDADVETIANSAIAQLDAI